MTSAALVAAAAGLLLTCTVFVAPAGSGSRLLRGVQLALAPVATVMLVLLTTGGSLARAEAGPVDEAARTGAHLTVVLRVTGEPSSIGPGAYGGGDRYLVDADVVGGILESEAFASTTPVVVLGPEGWSAVGTGDVIRVLGTVQPPHRVGRARGMFVPTSSPEIEQAEGWLGYTDDVRARFRAVSQEDQRDGGLLPGMALGDRVPLDPLLEEDMRATGLTHLTAVSGANCSYVVAFTFLGLRMLRCPRVAASVGAVVALTAFVLLVRPEPSVLRAAVMGAIGVAAVLSGRGKVSLTLLMLSVIVLLAVDPWLSVSFAFMLSVTATLGLVLAGPLVVRVLSRVFPRVLAQLVAIPLTAQVFCTHTRPDPAGAPRVLAAGQRPRLAGRAGGDAPRDVSGPRPRGRTRTRSTSRVGRAVGDTVGCRSSAVFRRRSGRRHSVAIGSPRCVLRRPAVPGPPRGARAVGCARGAIGRALDRVPYANGGRYVRVPIVGAHEDEGPGCEGQGCEGQGCEGQGAQQPDG